MKEKKSDPNTFITQKSITQEFTKNDENEMSRRNLRDLSWIGVQWFQKKQQFSSLAPSEL